MVFPTREKYIDEATGGPWFIFGKHTNGGVDVASTRGDIFEDISEDKANQIIKLHNDFMKKMYELLCYQNIPDKGSIASEPSDSVLDELG